MQRLRLRSSLAILLIATTLSVGHRTALAAETDEEGIRKTVNDFAETFNRHDSNAFGALFAPDADLVNVNGQRWKGRREIQTNFAFLHATIPPDSAGVSLPAQTYGVFKALTYLFDRVDVRFVHKDVALAHVAWTQLGDARFKEPRRGMLSFLVTRDGDRWVLNAVQNTLK